MFTVWGQNKPFPQALNYPGCIKPNVSQATLNSDVLNFYNYWKSTYLKKSTANPNHYYVEAESTGGSASAVTQSEAHGYGMVITALMAGADANAKVYYDGLYGMYDTHRSANNNNLMQWQVFADEHNAHLGSATDGDMDIAYSLLLAHYQWGSNGSINYLDAAKKMITNGLKASYVYSTLRLGLADDPTNDHLSTRPSDWMFDHMRAFKNHTNDVVWDQLASNLYNIYSQIFSKYSPNTGLMSDFVMYDPPQPAPPGQPQADEGSTTGDYSYNACRIPLRLVMDFAHYGTSSPKPYLAKMVSWAKSTTGNNPSRFQAGYKLSGTPLSGSNYQAACFISPMVAAGVIDPANQQWVNDGWNFMKSTRDGYYEDTYNMLCMLFVSGNWWVPQATSTPNNPPTISLSSPSNGASFTSGTTITISASASDADGSVTAVDFLVDGVVIGSDASSPYSINYTAASGTHTIAAKATDNLGASTTSTSVSITVTNPVNQNPVVSITSPANGASFSAPANITINVSSSDPDGNVSKVDFYNGSNLIGTDNSSPYSYTWSNVAAGSYTIKVIATDDKGATSSASISAAVNATNSSTMRVIGYAPTWINFPGIVNTVDLTKLTHINIAFANPNTSGVLTGVNSSDIATVVNKAHANNVKVLISIGGAGANAGTYRTLLSNSTNRTNFVNNLVNYAVTNNLDGIDVDIEGDVLDGTNVTSSQYQSFVTQLASALHGKGKIMTSALATWFADYVTNTAASQFDFINIMSYDAAIPGTGDAAGPHSSYQLAVNDFNYWHNTKGVPGANLNIGVPFYGYGWGSYAVSGNDEIAYSTIVNKYPGSENNDVVGSGSNAIYYNGIPTIKQKTTFAVQNAGGVMIWEIAEDVTDNRSLLLAIDQVIHNTTTNKAPTVSISSPSNGASFTTGATVSISANASDPDGTVSKVDFFVDGVNVGTKTSSPYTMSYTPAAGTHSITAKATDDKGAFTTSSAVSITVTNPTTQTPYGGSAWPIPGKVEAENYDLGGEGIAYHDANNGNSGGAYRNDNVDIESNNDGGAGFNVGWVEANEWMEYTVNVQKTSTYRLDLRVASIYAGKTFRIEMDGQNISGTITVPNTGNWATFQTVSVNNISLSAGTKIMRIYFISDLLNVNYVTFTDVSNPVNQLPTASITSPAANASFTAPANVVITANANDSDGTISKVEFFNGTFKIGEATSAPYTMTWSSVPAGTYNLTAVATDNQGGQGSSSAVTIKVNTVQTNIAPSVAITSPANNASFTAPATIAIAANASDSDGSVTKVAFYNGTTLLNEDATQPYSYSWSNVAAGTYTINAIATDNQGATKTASITITVTNSNNLCSGIPQYVENGGYVDGSKVQNAGGVYQCKPYPYTGWCNGAAWAYGPGTGSYWTDAWTKVGTCTAKMSSTSNASSMEEISVYPNPTNSASLIKLNVADVYNADIVVANPMGVEIYKGKMNSNLESTIDLGGMNSGIYMIKIVANGNVWYQKLVKE